MYQRRSEILKEINDAWGNKKRIALLHKYSKDVKEILNLTFHPDIIFLVAGKTHEFTPSQDNPVSASQRFKRELAKIRKYTTMHYDKIPDKKYLQRLDLVWIQTLEFLHPDDAEILIHMKDKRLPPAYNKITKELVAEAFPILSRKWEKHIV